MFDILGNYRIGGSGDSTAVCDATGNPAHKGYWDAAYGYSIAQSDFQEILFNLKAFGNFLKDIS